MCLMVTDKSLSVGDNLVRFLGGLLLAWAVSITWCNVALGQGALDQPDPPAAAARDADDAAEPADAEEPTDEPKKEFASLPVDPSLKNTSGTINSILMAGRFEGDQQKQAFDDFYLKYFLPRWTQQKNYGTIPGYRKELRVSHLGRRSANAAVHDHLNGLVLEFMKKLATGPYHPAVQVNAMLMIGELNSVEQPTPVPLPEALDVLIGAVDDPNAPDAIRAAALVGIQRHVAMGKLSDEARKKLDTDLLKLASSELPKGSAAEGRDWIIGQALETLGNLGSVGDNGAVVKQMLKAVADTKLSFSTRVIAAESLGNLNYSGAAGVNPVDAAAVLGRFAIDACANEIQLVKEHEYPVSRRRMKQRLGAVIKALAGGGAEDKKGIASLAKDDAAKAFIGELQKETEGMFKTLDDPRHEGDDMEEPVGQLQEKLKAWLKQIPR